MATFIPGVTDIIPEPKLYTPDFGFIDKMMQRKSAMYEEGFAKLNNQYKLISREVTNPANATMRDEFLKAAKNNLKDLATMDLSDPTNVRNAEEVFKPFYSNTLVLGDQALTKHWNQQLAIADGLRLKDGGKEYSQDNVNYILQQKQMFKDDDPSTVGEYMASKRFYTPYYDYHKEVEEAMKNFKPSHTVLKTMNGMYIKTVDDASWNKLEIAKYLNGVLSDRAKQQMRIEGAVRLGNDQTFLLNTYMSTQGAKIPELTKLIDDIDSKIKVEKDPDILNQLKQNRDYYDNQRSSISNNLKSFRGGDMSFLKKNAEALAFDVYYDALMDKKSNAFTHKEIKQDIDFDQVQMMYYKEAQANWRHSDSIANQWKMEEYKANKAVELEKIKLGIQYANDYAVSPTGPLDLNEKDITAATLQTQYEDKNILFTRAYQDLAKIVATKNNMTLEEMKTGKGLELIKQFSKANPENSVVKAFNEAFQQKNVAGNRIKLDIQNAERDAKYTLGNSIYNVYEIYKKNNNNIALTAKALGKDVTSVTNSVNAVNAFITNRRNTAHTLTGINESGLMYGTESKPYKEFMAMVGNVIPKDDITGTRWFFNKGIDTKSTVAFSIKAGSALDKQILAAEKPDDLKIITDGFASGFNGAEVSISKDKKSIIVKGLDPTLTDRFNPYKNIPKIDRDVLNYLNQTTLGRNESATDYVYPPDAGGTRRVVGITKTQLSTGAVVYDYSINGARVDAVNFSDPVQAYQHASQYLQFNSQQLDDLINRTKLKQ